MSRASSLKVEGERHGSFSFISLPCRYVAAAAHRRLEAAAFSFPIDPMDFLYTSEILLFGVHDENLPVNLVTFIHHLQVVLDFVEFEICRLRNSAIFGLLKGPQAANAFSYWHRRPGGPEPGPGDHAESLRPQATGT